MRTNHLQLSRHANIQIWQQFAVSAHRVAWSVSATPYSPLVATLCRQGQSVHLWSWFTLSPLHVLHNSTLFLPSTSYSPFAGTRGVCLLHVSFSKTCVIGLPFLGSPLLYIQHAHTSPWYPVSAVKALCLCAYMCDTRIIFVGCKWVRMQENPQLSATRQDNHRRSCRIKRRRT
jgi:hypothetical protein